MEQNNAQNLLNRELLQSISNQTPSDVIGLIQRGADPSFNNNRPIRHASYFPSAKIISILLSDPRVDPSVDNNLPIRVAASEGYLEAITYLLRDPRVDPSADSSRALRVALANDHWNVVQKLLWDRRVDPSVDNNAALKRAIKLGDDLAVRVLLSDPRVDWRLIRGTQYEPNFYPLIARKKEELRKSMLPLLGILRENKNFLGGTRAAQSIGRRATFEYGVNLLCSDLRKGLVPTIEIVELIRMLNATGYIDDGEAEVMQNLGSKRDACERIRYALDRFKDDQIIDASRQGELKRRRT